MKTIKFYDCELCGRKAVFKEYVDGVIKVMEIRRIEKLGPITGPHDCSHNIIKEDKNDN